MKCSIISVVVVLIFGTTAIHAQPLRMKGIIEQHNHWRKEVGVPPLKWSVKLAKQAEAWATSQSKKDCKCAHSTDQMYGENLYCSTGIINDPGAVVNSWAAENKFYNPSNGKCKGGECGHYTQIVWRGTTEVGCAMVRCGDKELWVCNYNPPGNYLNKKAY